MNPPPREILAALDSEWRTTQEVARRLGLTWRSGSADLRPLRDALYALTAVRPDLVEQQPRGNGHRWRTTTGANHAE